MRTERVERKKESAALSLHIAPFSHAGSESKAERRFKRHWAATSPGLLITLIWWPRANCLSCHLLFSPARRATCAPLMLPWYSHSSACSLLDGSSPTAERETGSHGWWWISDQKKSAMLWRVPSLLDNWEDVRIQLAPVRDYSKKKMYNFLKYCRASNCLEGKFSTRAMFEMAPEYL